ncbi:phosphohistidine phosphatase [Elizabethkingia argentiflava]|uniref:Phosphohistidine phosphatase n=1 Tax=Elizabethkingia argenteiflava TaxID=2681556 RepID=A0A845PU53_9FLAO|nr:histidine phosphatase family protein [Elizabethkingia argenteiflava]NAW51175.1 phosphohistidine phosphatase [Elizabethkingia argenteiflava]
MKKLILVRHAKSDWPEGVEDFNRPLTEHGKSNASAMAAHLKEKGIAIQALISSPANRAYHTCLLFHEVYKKAQISTYPPLYNAHESDFMETIHRIDDDYTNVALFSHNNGISNFTNLFSGKDIISFPTCGVGGFEIDIDCWKDFNGDQCVLKYFYSPKDLHTP